MLFNSVPFLLFFPLVLAVHFILPKRVRYLWLLAASYYFYICWNPAYALLMLTSTAITYLSGLLIWPFCSFSNTMSLQRATSYPCWRGLA